MKRVHFIFGVAAATLCGLSMRFTAKSATVRTTMRDRWAEHMAKVQSLPPMTAEERESYARRIAKAMNCNLAYARDQVDFAESFDGDVESCVEQLEEICERYSDHYYPVSTWNQG